MWIKIPEASKRLGVSVPTLRRAIAEGTLEGVRTIKVGVSTMLCAEDITLSSPNARPSQPGQDEAERAEGEGLSQEAE